MFDGNPAEPFGPRTAPAPTVSRRVVLTGAVAVLLAANPLLRRLERVSAATDFPAGAAAHDTGPHRWAMVIDLRRCDGCKKCIEACQAMHHLPKSQEWIRVYEMADESGGAYFMPVPCQQCEHPPCTNVCPVRATYSRDDGIVVVDQDVCIGCRMCLAACPYGVRVFNWDAGLAVPDEERSSDPAFTLPQRKGTASKCTFCVHLLENDQVPACIEKCEMEALFIGDLVNDSATNGHGGTVVLSQYLRDNHAFRFKTELGTEPRVYYVAGFGEELGY